LANLLRIFVSKQVVDAIVVVFASCMDLKRFRIFAPLGDAPRLAETTWFVMVVSRSYRYRAVVHCAGR
jgi:hypothetical protein